MCCVGLAVHCYSDVCILNCNTNYCSFALNSIWKTCICKHECWFCIYKRLKCAFNKRFVCNALALCDELIGCCHNSRNIVPAWGSIVAWCHCKYFSCPFLERLEFWKNNLRLSELKGCAVLVCYFNAGTVDNACNILGPFAVAAQTYDCANLIVAVYCEYIVTVSVLFCKFHARPSACR